MAIENNVNLYNSGQMPYGEFVSELEKEANAPKEPELTGIRKHLKLIGIKKETGYSWLVALIIGGFIFARVSCLYKNAQHRIEGYPSHIVRMEGIKYKKELRRNWDSCFIENQTERIFFDSETEKRNKGNDDPNVMYFPCGRKICSPYEHLSASEQQQQK